MPPEKTRAPAIEGWFTLDERDPHLLGTRCTACGTYHFPKESAFCRNPHCAGSAFEQVELSSRGRLWSYTDNRYPPPPPYVAGEPFEPYAIAAVELEREKLVVLGQVVAGVGSERLEVGAEMQLALERLYEDDGHEYVVWKWRPS
jgi:uncharacterized OB-fold protein